MAGNVVTGEMVEELVLSGADLVKVRSTVTAAQCCPEFHLLLVKCHVGK
jgi:metal-sulfur cluster biosynthetic enzyme